jgi:asparagine synthase (glutamine-hydrolysing)
LFYTQSDGQLIFGSEIKSILAYPGMQAEIDPISLDQIFTFWSTLSPRTAFKDIFELPPGHYLLAGDGQFTIQPYWTLDFSREPDPNRAINDYQDEFESLLIDAAKIRLRADVPVGAYLSGGLDSSTIAAIIQNYTDVHLDTFSIAFSDPEFDESQFQMRMAHYLGTEHQVVYTQHEDIGEIFPHVIWHTETPILRTSPAPMYLLSKLVRDHKYKVVLTGEGADEFLAGYNIFKEAKIRRFWAQQPNSEFRPSLLTRLYPHISNLPNSSVYLASFFGDGLLDTDAPDYSHSIRWRTTSRAKRFFSEDMSNTIKALDYQVRDAIVYPEKFSEWDPMSQAQYLESSIFMAEYLLSSQGDRMGMAHSVEGRFPFLDHRVVEMCNRLPAYAKMLGLTEKYLLKRLAKKWLPEEILERPKRPYRAPIHRSFFNDFTSQYVRDLLSDERVIATGLFKPQAVKQMVRKLDAGRRLGETDDMALAGIISSQLVHQQFVLDFRVPAPLTRDEVGKVCIGHNARLNQESHGGLNGI